jgi:hypothetical protein
MGEGSLGVGRRLSEGWVRGKIWPAARGGDQSDTQDLRFACGTPQ